MSGYSWDEPLDLPDGETFPVRWIGGPRDGIHDRLSDVPPVLWIGDWEDNIFVRTRYIRDRQTDTDGTTRYVHAGYVDLVAVRDGETTD